MPKKKKNSVNQTVRKFPLNAVKQKIYPVVRRSTLKEKLNGRVHFLQSTLPGHQKRRVIVSVHGTGQVPFQAFDKTQV
jgi:hypothetical protein